MIGRTPLVLVLIAGVALAVGTAFPAMNKFTLPLAGLFLLAAVLVCTGCQSLDKKIDGLLPEGSAKKVTATVTGKFSATILDAEDFVKTHEKITASKLHLRHSNAWVPLIEIEMDGYERDRVQYPVAPAVVVTSPVISK